MMKSIVAGVAILSTTAASVLDLKISIQKSYSVVHVGVGTPPVDHALLFDTGSSTLWLIDSSCTPENCLNGSGLNRNVYNLSASHTGKEFSAITDSIEYSGGTVTGLLASDVVTVGHTSFPLNFAAITKSTWSSLAADGFLGLASSSIAFSNTTSFFETIMQKGLADQPRFGIYKGSALPTVANSSPDNNGVLTLGGSREKKYSDKEVKFVDLSSPFQVYKTPFHSLNITNSVNGTKFNTPWTGSVVADTGAATITVPQQYVSAIYAATPWTFESLTSGLRPLCSDFTDDWSVSLTLGVEGKLQTFTVTGSMLAIPGYVDDDHCFPPFNFWDSQNIIIGSVWLRNFYSVFDFGSFNPAHYKMRMGFAPLKREFLPKV
ncbi:hypothetical protein GALMADRAFT_229700 [Galerina marginata CBS 339.88]|uniref:Peptidase A1 domain-containing protein n=1 Tax=Galerina marginata (strain CBS 339.88) TaxID=685588 RepID=A0A067SJH6_GALM3|nr:hypothetical protein GALMADRAFT_229700 [Galerina marginata CBS 339.88]